MSNHNSIKGYGFVILPDGRKNALELAFKTFPELKDEFDSLHDEFSEDVYYVYGLLATEMVSHWNDEMFRNRSYRFLDGLDESGDSFLENLLVVCLLERLAVDEAMSEQAKISLGERARELLSCVEREMFGRK